MTNEALEEIRRMEAALPADLGSKSKREIRPSDPPIARRAYLTNE